MCLGQRPENFLPSCALPPRPIWGLPCRSMLMPPTSPHILFAQHLSRPPRYHAPPQPWMQQESPVPPDGPPH